MIEKIVEALQTRPDHKTQLKFAQDISKDL